MERELRELGWKVFRMSGADLKLFLPAARRAGRPDRRVRRLPRRRDLLPDGRTQRLPAAGGPDARLDGAARGRRADRPGRSRAGAGLPLRPRLAGAGPVVPERRPAGRPAAARRVVRRRPARPGRAGTTSSAPGAPRSRAAAHPFAVLGRRPPPGGRARRRPRLGHRPRHRLVPAAGLRRRRGRLLQRGPADDPQPAQAARRRAPDVRQLPLDDLRGGPAHRRRAGPAAGGAVPLRARPRSAASTDRPGQPLGAVLDGAAPRRLAAPGVRRRPTAACPRRQLDGLSDGCARPSLQREIEAAGGRVVHVEHGPGRDFFGQDDPHVARMEIRWDHGARPAPDRRRKPCSRTPSQEIPDHRGPVAGPARCSACPPSWPT